MRILLTNDDGIRAPGLRALYEVLVSLDLPAGSGGGREPIEVFTVAPETVQSATSHGVTFDSPLMTQEVEIDSGLAEGMRGVAVDGRPADCMKLALARLWQDRFGENERPDLVVSGMNAGANCGINVLYSGTVAAAIEAAFLGVPAIAVSLLLNKQTPDFRLGARRAGRAIRAVLTRGERVVLPEPHECLNINVPATPLGSEGDDLPVAVCPMNIHGLNDAFDERESPYGARYFWSAGHGLDFRSLDKQSDVDLLFRGTITVTPLTYDLTAHRMLLKWRDRVAHTPG